MSGDEHWMRLALDEAQRAAAVGEVPVGAVVVVDDRCIATGYNQPISTADPSAHAEIVALRAAAAARANYRLPGCTLFVTVEPCLMCAGALLHARISRLVFGAREPRSGAVASVARVLEIGQLNHKVAVTEGILEAACSKILVDFFRAKRGSV